MISCSFFLGLFHAGHVFERHLFLLRGVAAGPRLLPKLQGLVSAALAIWRIMKIQKASRTMKGDALSRMETQPPDEVVLDIRVDFLVVEQVVERPGSWRHLGVESLVGILVETPCTSRSAMVTSFTSPPLTFSRNWVKLMESSLIPWPWRTTAKSSTAHTGLKPPED